MTSREDSGMQSPRLHKLKSQTSSLLLLLEHHINPLNLRFNLTKIQNTHTEYLFTSWLLHYIAKKAQVSLHGKTGICT